MNYYTIASLVIAALFILNLAVAFYYVWKDKKEGKL